MNWTYPTLSIVLIGIFAWAAYFTMFAQSELFQLTAFMLMFLTAIIGIGVYGHTQND